MMELVNLAQDYGVFLLRFHFDDHGHHSKPHRRVCDEPDRRRGEDRQDGAGEETPETDFSQRASEDDLGRDGGRGNERDEPQPLDPSIGARRPMHSQDSAQLAPSLFAASNAHELDRLEALTSDGFLGIGPDSPDLRMGRRGGRAWAAAYFSGFPDSQWTKERIFGQDAAF